MNNNNTQDKRLVKISFIFFDFGEWSEELVNSREAFEEAEKTIDKYEHTIYTYMDENQLRNFYDNHILFRFRHKYIDELPKGVILYEDYVEKHNLLKTKKTMA